MNSETVEQIITGCIEGEAFVSVVDTTGDGDFIELDECGYVLPRKYMGKTWVIYLRKWFLKNSDLIEKVLEEYETHEYGAWVFGFDVAHTVLRTGVGFSDRDFLDADVSDLLDDSLDDFKTDDGLHEMWFEDNKLRIERWVTIDCEYMNERIEEQMITLERNALCVGEIRRRNSFKNKGMTMHGEWLHPDDVKRGRLNSENWKPLEFLGCISNAVYVVFSYETPIVAVTDFGDKWECDQYFSNTTARHKNLFKRGL